MRLRPILSEKAMTQPKQREREVEFNKNNNKRVSYILYVLTCRNGPRVQLPFHSRHRT
uniref:Uncharacterized protein n=1 Tax=Picea glauca TaxID=3330 RepID=A0A124GNT3_PICGL|nr:hypothetical protein ABT39_MTgene3063 [Picea glauca]